MPPPQTLSHSGMRGTLGKCKVGGGIPAPQPQTTVSKRETAQSGDMERLRAVLLNMVSQPYQAV